MATTVKHKLIGVLKNDAREISRKIKKLIAAICKQAML